MSVGLWSQK